MPTMQQPLVRTLCLLDGQNTHQQAMHVYEVRPRKDRRGFDLMSDVLPFGRLCYDGPNAVRNTIAKLRAPPIS